MRRTALGQAEFIAASLLNYASAKCNSANTARRKKKKIRRFSGPFVTANVKRRDLCQNLADTLIVPRRIPRFRYIISGAFCHLSSELSATILDRFVLVNRKSHKPARTRKFKLHHHRLSPTRLSFIRLVGSPFPIETNHHPTSMPVATFFRFVLDRISSSYYVSNGRNSPGHVASSFFNFIARHISFASFAAWTYPADDTSSGIIPVTRS